jgi:hypothetical protein
VPPPLPSRHIDRANYAADAPTRDDDSSTLAPDFVEFIQEGFVVRQVAKLTGVSSLILLQVEVGWARHHKVNGLVGHEAKVSSIRSVNTMVRETNRGFEARDGGPFTPGL